MKKILFYLAKVLLVFMLINFNFIRVYGEEVDSVLQQLEILQNDIKTLEKAVYNQNFTGNISDTVTSSGDNDVLTKHLLKLSELEEQFKILTNNFEEINFKLDKLSNRITKIQTDNQVRFQDIESRGLTETESAQLSKEKKLPGSGEAQDLGGISDSDLEAAKQIQKTQSIESAGTVVTETAARVEKILPDTTPEEQYKFAVSFIKVGDYETAEFALREFVDTNSKHQLAGNAQYWLGETFYARQNLPEATRAFLVGIQRYPNSMKAPDTMLKLGISLAKLGKSEDSCAAFLEMQNRFPNLRNRLRRRLLKEMKAGGCN